MLIRLLIISLALSTSVSANIISQFETQFDTDFAYAGVGGLRGTGNGDIVLSGVSGSISQAYLYWHGPTNSSDPNFNGNITLDGNNISGINIGTSADNSWGQLNSQAYRADVTSLIAGDGTYSLAGLSPNNSNGASLIVYYDDGDDTNNRDVVSFDGNDSNFANSFDPIGWDTTLSGIDYSGGGASLLLGVSDGQSFVDGSLLVNGNDLGIDFNGTTVPQTAGTTVGNGALWDLIEVDISSLLSIGLNNLDISYSGGGDALSAIHYQVILPAGSAPPVDPIPRIPEPPVLLLLLIGLSSILVGQRKA